VPDAGYVAAAVGIAAGLTWATRAVPFAVLAPMRDSVVIRHLSRHMPLGVLILAVYTLRDVPAAPAREALAFGSAVVVTVGLHLWRRNALISILAGTAVSVALATTLGG